MASIAASKKDHKKGRSEWYDRKIAAGTAWAQEIDEHLEAASIILLLISADFLASDYCYDICIGFVLDISERKALERRKDEFIGIASHELKTPVTSLKGFLGLLRLLLADQAKDKVLHYLAQNLSGKSERVLSSGNLLEV